METCQDAMEKQNMYGDTFEQVYKFFLKRKCYVHIRTKQWRTKGKRYKEYLVLFRSTIYLF